MNFRKLMDEASKNASRETMAKWGDFLCELMDHLKESHHEIYEEYWIEFYEMNFGEHLNEHLARKWVDSMKSASGDGEHFTKSDADNYAKQIGLSFDGYNDWDWYAILNMIWSDYSGILGNNVDSYVRMAKATIEDIDVKNKAFKYYLYVVK